MANSLLTIDMVAKEAMRVAHEQSMFIATTDRQYDESFARSGAKIGSQLRVRYPNQFTRTQGSRVMAVQEQAERAGTITVATQDHVDMSFNSAELALSIDEMSMRYIQPAMKTLISGIEADYLAFATKATYNVAGTAGSAITSLATPMGARAKLNQGLAPKDGQRYVQMDSPTTGGLVGGVATYFNPSADISKQFREGQIARTAMADWYENERVWTMTNGADVTGTTDAAALVTDGGSTVDIHTTVPVANQAVGSVFTIAGVYACHPETKQAYATLQQFTITAIGASTTTVSPSTFLSGARKNVCSSTGADLSATDFNSKTLTFVGALSTSYVQSLMYHKEAFQFVTADLPLKGGSESCVRMVQDGLALRVWRDGDIRNDEDLLRIDILYGFSAFRPEWACRMIGSAS